MFIFDRCCRSSAAVTPVKYECDANNITGTFARSKILLTEKLTNGALVTPIPGVMLPTLDRSLPSSGTLWYVYSGINIWCWLCHQCSVGHHQSYTINNETHIMLFSKLIIIHWAISINFHYTSVILFFDCLCLWWLALAIAMHLPWTWTWSIWQYLSVNQPRFCARIALFGLGRGHCFSKGTFQAGSCVFTVG